MAESTNQLDYARPPAWHRRRRVRRIVLLLAIVIVGLASVKWLGAGWRHAQLLYWQRQCMRHTVSPQQVIDPAAPSSWTQVRQWQEFYRLLSPPGRRPSPVLFLHEMRRKDGPPRLVAIEFWPRMGNFATFCEFNYHVFEPGGLWSRPRLLKSGSSPMLTYIREIPPKLYTAQLDPQDPSHLDLKYVGTRGDVPDVTVIIDGWLQADDTILFQERKTGSARIQ
jgi:hypothetical protein